MDTTEGSPAYNADKIREQNRLRAKRFYEANKDKIKQTRKEKHAEKKANPPAELKVSISNDELLERLAAIDMNPNTKKKYLADFKRLMTAINNEPLINHMRQGQSLIDAINTSAFSTNTKKGLVQCVLYMITKLELNINKKAHDMLINHFELLKQIGSEEHKEKSESETVLTWKAYMDKIRAEFGADSKMYLIASLYNFLCIRDDYQLKIVQRKPKDTSDNYLVLSKDFQAVINQYKTQNKYGQISEKLSKGLTRMISAYMAKHNLKVGDYLFDDELSSYVIRSNKKIGVEGGISYFRKMSTSELLNNPDVTAEEKIELANQLKHSVFVQSKYLRKLE